MLDYAPASKIIFLDLDGVLTTWRSILQTGSSTALDPVASRGVSHLCEASGAKVVLTGERSVRDCPPLFKESKKLLDTAGFDIGHLHSHWSSCTDIRGRREDQIKVFLNEHPEVTHHVIVDANIIRLPNLVRISPDDGILTRDFREIAKILDFDMTLAFNIARKQDRLPGQQGLPLDAFPSP